MKVPIRPTTKPKSKAAAVPATKTKKKSKEELDLGTIYRTDKKEQFAKLDGKPRNDSFRRIAFGGIFLAALAVVGWFFMRPAQAPTPATVSVTTDSQPSMVAGAYVTIPFTIKNDLSVRLNKATVEVLPPVGWLTKETDPALTPNTSLTWTFDNVAPGEQRVVKVSGWLLQPIGWSGSWRFTGSYEPSNFSSAFPINGVWAVETASSAFTLSATKGAAYAVSFQTPETVLPDGLELHTSWPIALARPQYAPAPSDQTQPVWAIPSGQNNFSVSITPEAGSLPTVPTGTDTQQSPDAMQYKLGAELWWKNPATGSAEARKVVSAELPLTPETVDQTLRVVSKVNNVTTARSVDWGRPFNWSFTIENPTNSAVYEGRLRFFVRSDALGSISLLDDAQKEIPLVYDADKGFVTVTKEQFPALANIGAQSSVTARFSVGLKAFSDLASKDLSIERNISGYAELVASSKAPQVGTKQKPAPAPTLDVTVQTKPQNIALNGFWVAKSSLRYYADTKLPVGTGPMPFVAGQNTTLQLRHELTNVNHTLQQLKWSAMLPKDVIFIGAGESSDGSWAFDESTRTLTWTNGEIVAATTPAGKTVTAIAWLSVKPSVADKKTESILPAGSIDGRDMTTGGVTSFPTPAFTTAMESDPFAKNDGSVRASAQ